jgi:hypothetical protein
MGLDMYINQCNRTDHTTEQLLDINNIETLNPETPEAAPFLPLRNYEFIKAHSIFHEAGYWRKANAIHGWFVNNVQNGVDDCGYYELTEEILEKLLSDVKETIKTKNTAVLSPRSGFFFGSTAVDEWYWKDLKATTEIIKKVLAKDWSKYRFFYNSSW